MLELVLWQLRLSVNKQLDVVVEDGNIRSGTARVTCSDSDNSVSMVASISRANSTMTLMFG